MIKQVYIIKLPAYNLRINNKMPHHMTLSIFYYRKLEMGYLPEKKICEANR